MYRLFAVCVLILIQPLSIRAQETSENQSEKDFFIDVMWYTSKPFIYENEEGILEGIEHDLLVAYTEYLKEKTGMVVELHWLKTQSFANIFDEVSERSGKNVIGSSAFSITEERKKIAQFSESYLPDVTVLVSNAETPIVRSESEFIDMVKDMKATTVGATQYEALINNLNQRLNLNLEIVYLESDQNILDDISANPDHFGFIDLPVYLMLIQNGGNVTRQNLYTVRGQGYSFLLPLDSKWKTSLDEFFTDPANTELISGIISNYLGEELYDFLEEMDASEELSTSILTKEKELQLALIENANLKLKEEQSQKNALIIGFSTTGLFLAIIGYLFYRNNKTTKLLVSQKDQISTQQEDIGLKNEQLVNRNAQLMAINEEKNNLIKILAHDIRSPLSQIVMITELLLNPPNESDLKQEDLINKVGSNAHRISDMVAKILDTESPEDDRLKVMRERVDVREILSEIQGRYKDQAKKKNINFQVEPCESNYMIRTDHLLITLILENLVSNAIKFCSEGASVKLLADCKYDGVVFKVCDEGPGFTEEDKELLFNRFQKLSAKPTGGESSIGLGLSIVKKYVSDIGGEVWLESEEGKGSTFFVKLTV